MQECTHALLLRDIHILDEGSAASLLTSEQAGGGHSSIRDATAPDLSQGGRHQAGRPSATGRVAVTATIVGDAAIAYLFRGFTVKLFVVRLGFGVGVVHDAVAMIGR